MKPRTTLCWVLRVMGSFSLLAIPFVFVPRATMEAIHAQLGIGELPRAPIVGYLARSLSAFYALVGGLLWLLSFDPERHRSVLIYLGSAIALMGGALLFIDLYEGLPAVWTWWEGPFVALFGATILLLARRLPR